MLTSTGLGSGLNINALVDAMVNAQNAPKQAQFNRDQAVINAEISAVGSLKSGLSKFLDKLKPLAKPDAFQGTSIKTSNEDFIEAKADKGTVPGRYTVSVEQLARSQKQGTQTVSDVEAAVGEGSLKFTVDGDSFTVDVSAEDDLKDVVNKINESEDNKEKGVTATIINSDAGAKLVITSKKTGLANNVTVEATDAAGSSSLSNTFNMNEVQAAKDSVIVVDGLRKTSASNTVEDAIDGITIDLKEADAAKTTTITVSQDKDATKKSLKEFVKAFNDMSKTMKGLSHYDADKKTAGALQGDAMMRSMNSQIRNTLSSSFSAGSSQVQLAEFGITTKRDGTLEIDDDILDKAIDNDLPKLTEFFTKEDTGFVAKMTDKIEVYSKTGGILDNRDESLDGKLDRLQDQKDAFGRKMSSLESRLRKQFNAMDSIVGQLNAQQNFLAQRLASLPGAARN
ncbi:flagellar filament capping protein FliD [Parashewanella tropica]|uniref:flagellar filament capping protein FliD n=1 Tax=Parashewanella tropica TaxID=2547970 RepID=UPI001059F4B3|nr:flagellar filament capping protein FliD [Parashewanella tropica]